MITNNKKDVTDHRTIVHLNAKIIRLVYALKLTTWKTRDYYDESCLTIFILSSLIFSVMIKVFTGGVFYVVIGK